MEPGIRQSRVCTQTIQYYLVNGQWQYRTLCYRVDPLYRVLPGWPGTGVSVLTGIQRILLQSLINLVGPEGNLPGAFRWKPTDVFPRTQDDPEVIAAISNLTEECLPDEAKRDRYLYAVVLVTHMPVALTPAFHLSMRVQPVSINDVIYERLPGITVETCQNYVQVEVLEDMDDTSRTTRYTFDSLRRLTHAFSPISPIREFDENWDFNCLWYEIDKDELDRRYPNYRT